MMNQKLPTFLFLFLLTLCLGCLTPETASSHKEGVQQTSGKADSSESLADYQRLQTLLSCPASCQTLKEQVLAEIPYRGGFPIQTGNSYTFVFKAIDGYQGEVHVTGDLNGWSTKANPMVWNEQQKLYWITLSINEQSGKIYKFYVAEQYQADPLARRFGWDEFGEYSLVAEDLTRSHLERYPAFHANQLGNTRDIFVYLPAGYGANKSDYQTIYFHDGQNVFGQGYFSWQAQSVLDRLTSEGVIEPVIAVGLANTPGRMSEYTHVPDDISENSVPEITGGQGKEYADLLVNQVLPFIEARYRARSDRDARAILGSSLGGLISYWIGLTYPQYFRYVGGMSSTFGWGKFGLENETVLEMVRDSDFGPADQDQIFYLDSGGGVETACDDFNGNGIWDDSGNDNYCVTLQMRELLKQKGFSEGENLHYLYEPLAPHHESAWNRRLPEAIAFFFSL